MKYKLACTWVLFLSGSISVFAQFNASGKDGVRREIKKDLYIAPAVQHSRSLQKAIAIPVLFVGAGLYAMTDNDVLNKYDVQEERNEIIPKFRHNADNYLQFAPIVATYGLGLAGVKGKNDLANQTAMLLKTELIVGVLTYSIKRITAAPRPDTGQPTSFPSGHTAQAFAAATFMAKEYGHKSVWYSIGAYAVATGVGTMRVMNNRHWVSDVLAGAGIGILSTNLVYLAHQYTWGKKHKVAKTLILPSYDGQVCAVSVVHGFK